MGRDGGYVGYSGQETDGAALPWEPIGAIPCIEADARIIASFPPLWSMIPSIDSLPVLPELEPGIESYPEQQGTRPSHFPHLSVLLDSH